jgi:hypothetical protein
VAETIMVEGYGMDVVESVVKLITLAEGKGS